MTIEGGGISVYDKELASGPQGVNQPDNQTVNPQDLKKVAGAY